MKNVFLLIIFLIGVFGYVPLSHRIASFSSQSFIDDHIPLVPIFVIPYLFFLVFIPLSIALLWNTSYITNYLIALIIVQWTALLFWFLLPTGVVRPEVTGNGFLSDAVRSVYTTDGASNEFPSSHVFLSLVSCYFLALAYPAWLPLSAIVTCLIVCSTVFTKQHYALDILGGAGWAAASVSLSQILTKFL